MRLDLSTITCLSYLLVFVCVCALSLHNCELLIGLINAGLSVNIRTPLWILSQVEADR